MDDKVKIGCVVVLYNPDEKVKSNIKKYPCNIDLIILVDNSENDNSFMFKELLSSNTKYMSFHNNTGIANALNVGIKLLLNETDYVITMDQDSVLNYHMVDVYRKYIEENPKGIFALSPKYNTDRNPNVASDGEEKIALSMQSGTIFSNELFSTIGFFDDKLFLDVVDWEFFLRMKKNGFPLIRCNSAVLDHEPAETKSTRILFWRIKYGIAAPSRYYYQSRNLLWTSKKYKSLTLLFVFFIKFLKILLLFDNKKEYVKSFIKGVKDAQNNQLGRLTE